MDQFAQRLKEKAPTADIIALFDQGAVSVDSTDPAGQTPLHIACLYERVDILEYLVQNGAHIEAQTLQNERALHLALKKVEDLPNICPTTQPLFHARWNVLRYLVKVAGAYVDAVDDTGWTPLQKACDTHGRLPTPGWSRLDVTDRMGLITFLVAHDADVELANKNGYTPLHLASRTGALCVVQHLVIQGHAKVNAQDRNGHSPLHFACAEGRTDVVKFLFSHGAIVDMQNRRGMTCLHSASNTGQLDVVEFLVQINTSLEATDLEGHTALHHACMNGRGHLCVIEYLIDQGIPINTQDNDGQTALFIPVQRGKLEMTRLLLDRGANVLAQDNFGSTVLHVTRSSEIAHLLVERGVPVNAQDFDMRTALVLACSRGSLEITRALLGHGANPLITDLNGSTPLHVTSMKDVAQCLVEEHAANTLRREAAYKLLTAKDKNGESPIQIAERKLEENYVLPTYKEFAQYLLAYSKRPLAVPPIDPVTKKRKKGEAATEMNPHLSDVQFPPALRASDLLENSPYRQVMYVIMGYLSPVDVMNE